MKRIALAVSLALFGTASAFAADLGPSYTKAPVMAPAYNWTGFYVGGNVGGQWGSADPTTSTIYSPIGYFAPSSVTAIAAVGAQHINSSSVTGGFTAGYNWQVSNAVFGLEGDINYFGFKGSAAGSAVYPCCTFSSFTVNSSVSADWLATIRGRIGFLATPSWLIYATGGAAIADVKGNFTFTDTYFGGAAESGTIRDTRVGWTAGVGGEYAVGNGWSLKAEYLYVDLGRAATTSTNLTSVTFGSYPSSVYTHSVDLKSNIVRVGVNYKFGG
ncbi:MULTISPECIES: outer membrane protein [unclassified Bradyrhizobium]|uniref:outer membrane protein n=1 Tax=unclassified Bradyrhizobium TaxID=2631580 RepID=UPI000489132C|nr:MULTISPECIES: outer membrane protein [unclassified Bradyrhizobium]MCP3467443.1 porin family protein [Bradyrhizobium sp. CCGUVB23]